MKKVLLVDDHADIRRLVRITLGQNFDIFEAEDGATALAIDPLHIVMAGLSRPSTSFSLNAS